MNLNEAVDQYIANSSYTTLEQAELFRASIRVLIVLRPQATTIGNEQVTFNSSALSDELDRADRFIRAKQLTGGNGGSGDNRVRTYDFSTLRS